MRLSVAEVRNLHPARQPDRLLTTPGLARGVQRRAEAPGFGLRRAEVPAGRPVKPALSISVQTKRPSFRMHTPRRVIHDTFSLRSFRRRSRRRSSARLSRCSRCAQRKNPVTLRESTRTLMSGTTPDVATIFILDSTCTDSDTHNLLSLATGSKLRVGTDHQLDNSAARTKVFKVSHTQTSSIAPNATAVLDPTYADSDTIHNLSSSILLRSTCA